MTHETLLIGPLTRDFIVREGLRWSQPGGAVWHGALALALGGPAGAGTNADRVETERVAVLATAGPWAGRLGVPGLLAAGVDWRGVATRRDAVFVNRYDADRRTQSLLSQAEHVPRGLLEGCAPAAAVIAPLMPGDVPMEAAGILRSQGAFVAADAQGWLRVAGDGGRIAARPINAGVVLAGAHAIKFSVREFRVSTGLAPDAEWRPAAIAAARRLQAEVLVSLGADGATLALSGYPGEIIEAPSPASLSKGDATGAGDILIATYARARSRGVIPAEALNGAVEYAHGVLQRRAALSLASALIPALRSLQSVASTVRLRVRRGARCSSSFLPDSPLATALFRHLAHEPLLDDDAGRRGSAIVAACWALFTAGWPDDAGLAPTALCRLVEAERSGMEMGGADPSDAGSLSRC